MPTQWNSAAAAMTTSASRSLIPWSATIAGTMPRRNSSRARRRAMFVTIWTWTHEWAVRPSRAALTRATCHHALTCWSALTASMSWSRRRLPRVGARMRIAAIASAGEARDGAGGRASISSCIEARVLARGAPKITERRAASRFTGIPTLAVAMTRNRKRSRSRTPPPAAKGGGFSRRAQVWLRTLGTVVGVATGMVALANNVLPKHSDDAEATPSPVVQQTVGSICDDVNRHDADRVSDAKLLRRRLRRGRTALQVRDALLESYQRTLRNAEHDQTRLAATRPSPPGPAGQRPAARAWTNTLERLRGIVAALDEAGTWAKLDAVADRIGRLRTPMDRDVSKVRTGLLGLGGGQCHLEAQRVSRPVVLPPHRAPGRTSHRQVDPAPAQAKAPPGTPSAPNSKPVEPAPTPTTPTPTAPVEPPPATQPSAPVEPLPPEHPADSVQRVPATGPAPNAVEPPVAGSGHG